MNDTSIMAIPIDAAILNKWEHSHSFQMDSCLVEKNTQRVIILTASMMVVEVVAGMVFGSMALLADGWHMGTHVAALGITLFTYRFARRHTHNPQYTFGTGKVGVLGGFASAVALTVIAMLMAVESVQRIIVPASIQFNEALIVAVIGLVVNLLSVLFLKEKSDAYSCTTENIHHHDHNLKAAYLHVLADALTSVLAILALLAGKSFGWTWMDPVMGIVGSAVITRWAYSLVRDTSLILLDSAVTPDSYSDIRSALESETNTVVSDLHLWQITPNHLAAIISVVSLHDRTPEYFKKRLKSFEKLVHVTIEINPADDFSSIKEIQ